MFGQPLGITRYIHICSELGTMLHDGDRVTLFVHEPVDPSLLALSSAFDARLVRPKFTNALWENLLLPSASKDIDVLLGPSYTLPLTRRGRSVLVIHSVDEVQPGVLSIWHNLTYSQKYRLSAHRADRVIVNAVSTKKRVHERYGVPESKIDVIWLGGRRRVQADG
jgi:hypothetical protein